MDPINEDVNGAINQSFFLSLSNIWTSNNWAIKNAVPEPIAILKDIKSVKFVENKRVMSVGYDPMIAVMNNIATIDDNSQNDDFELADDTILDFTESNPFGDAGMK